MCSEDAEGFFYEEMGGKWGTSEKGRVSNGKKQARKKASRRIKSSPKRAVIALGIGVQD